MSINTRQDAIEQRALTEALLMTQREGIARRQQYERDREREAAREKDRKTSEHAQQQLRECALERQKLDLESRQKTRHYTS